MQLDYLIIGHFTRDMLPNGATSAGGTALYAALTAYRLGCRVGVVSASAELPLDWPTNIALAHTDAAVLPTFENQYTNGQRTQMLHAIAPSITLADIPEAWRNTPIVHLGPVLMETPEELVFAFPNAFIGVTPQGWMRTWGASIPSPISPMAWKPHPSTLRRINALVLSVEDVQGDEQQAVAYAEHCPLVALTRGAGGATLFIHSERIDISAYPTDERDPTGAGDVFAAALFCTLNAGANPLAAADYAARIAAASVATVGARGLLEARFETDLA